MFSSLLFSRDNENRAIAKFIYGLPKFIGDKKGGLCVYGYDQLVVEFKEQYKDIVFLKSDNDLTENYLAQNLCSVVYMANNRYSSIKYFAKLPVVLVGVDESFIAKGGMMIVKVGRRSFELSVNYITLKESKIKFDPLIEGLIIN